jgi:hypothetical protein
LPKFDKKKLERLIYANGGRFVQGVPSKTPRLIISRVVKCARGRVGLVGDVLTRLQRCRARALSAADITSSARNGSLIAMRSSSASCWTSAHGAPCFRMLLTCERSYYTHQSDDPAFDGGAGEETEDEETMLVDEPKPIDEDDEEGEETPDAADFASLKDVRRAVPDSEDEDDEDLRTNGNARGGKSAIDGAHAADQSWDDLGPSPTSSPARPRSIAPASDDEDSASPAKQRYIAPAPGGMGAEEPEMQQYDPDAMFKPLVFYFDTKENAASLRLPHSTALPAKSPIFVEVAGYLKKCGGRIVDSITDPSITHIVLAKRDSSRVAALRQSSCVRCTESVYPG